jgi:hypothetical protein
MQRILKVRWLNNGHAVRILAVLGVIFLSFAGSAQAQGSPAISQGFETEEKNIALGSLMSFKKGSQSKVELAVTDGVSELVGVSADSSLLEFSTNKNKVQIVTSGITNVLVSNINGEVSNGDKITASPLAGIGMRTPGDTQIVGIAQADLNSVSTVVRQIKTRTGDTKTVKVGRVPLQVNVSYFAKPKVEATFIPDFLQQAANSIAGKEVALIRVVLSLVILLLGFVSVGVMFYASVRSSIISIGRNPLSEGAVRKSLFGVAAVALGILLVMLSAIYLVIAV